LKPFNILAVVQPGLEDIAQKELNALGYKDLVSMKGGFFLKGHLSTVMKLNFACRCISRVLIEIAEFEAHSFSQLEHHFAQIRWEDYLSGQNVCIRVSSFQSHLYHEKAIAERLIDSLYNIFGKPVTVVGSPDEENTQLIVLYVKHDRFTVRMDTTGTHLHKRGYGSYKEAAPLRETLACGMLYALGWNEKIANLHDPMCGSGTIALEAALMAKKIPHCEFREFAFQKWSFFKQDVYDKIRAELLQSIINNPDVSIIASDIDPKAIDSARRNAEQAGIDKLIDFEVAELGENSVDSKYTIVTNPPWGKRISAEEILTLWDKLHLLATAGQKVYLILPEIQERVFAHKFRTLLRFESGGIKVKFIKLEA
jgi:putative N6-adenine-specific DNA methylase